MRGDAEDERFIDGFFDIFDEAWFLMWALPVVGVAIILVAVFLWDLACLVIGLVVTVLSSLLLFHYMKGLGPSRSTAQTAPYASPPPPGYQQPPPPGHSHPPQGYPYQQPPPPGHSHPPQGYPYHPPPDPQVQYPYLRPQYPTPEARTGTCPSCGGQVFAGRAYCPHCSATL